MTKKRKTNKKKETATGRLGMCHCKIIEANKCTARHLKLWGNFSPSPSLGTTASHTPPLPASARRGWGWGWWEGKEKEEEEKDCWTMPTIAFSN